MRKTEVQERYGLFIDGEWIEPSEGKTIDSFSPFSGEKISTISEASKDDVDKAVKASWKAFETWSKTTAKERAGYLNQIADVIEENAEHFAIVESMDNGKPVRETLAVDVPSAVEHFRYFASAIMVDEGSATELDNDTLSLILREPVGVVGQIVPWNFPFLMAAWKLAPVLATGCCTVFSPSSQTSLSVLELARLTEGILPKGVFNVVTGSGSGTGQHILDHEGFSKLAFTGSNSIGKKVGLAAAEKTIPSTLELGGKSANIFFPDLDWEKALEGLQMGILFNQGQVCSAGSRVFVHEDIYDEFIAEAIKRFESVEIGHPLEDGTQMGALINEKHLNKVLGYVEIGKEEGARVATGGVRATEGDLAKGAYMKPTLLVDVTNDMRVAQEEIFGPVAVVIKFKDEDEVIAMANDSIYGLGGAVWTKDINRAFRVAKGIRTGRVWVNTYNQLPAGAPFGGYKASGIGRETHKSVMEHYSQVKNIMISTSENPIGFFPKK